MIQIVTFISTTEMLNILLHWFDIWGMGMVNKYYEYCEVMF